MYRRSSGGSIFVVSGPRTLILPTKGFSSLSDIPVKKFRCGSVSGSYDQRIVKTLRLCSGVRVVNEISKSCVYLFVECTNSVRDW